ncbi:Zinc finger protein [Aspergillus sclerotialis]|uniref:Zinc finger protein n=1 Tax=Aspergillus sclerotialis TaxID=2070753 RepID=A0A3A2ZW69_9EURO|nr:Zinc finger protein [Aspergillus sclerotialis]
MSPITVSKKQSSGTDDRESYTQMVDRDLEAIGRHCQYEFCHQLDFLPFRCESCRGTFCLEHRTEIAHRCPKEGEWARRRSPKPVSNQPTEKPNIYNSDQCSHVSCKTLINTLKDPGVRCPNCNKQYCLKHRLKEEHDCSNITPKGARPAGQAANANDTLRSMFSRVRTWGKDKSNSATATLTPKPKPNSAAARTAELNAMKKSAKGNASVPADRRIYLHVVGTSDTQKAEPPAGDFFYDSRWKVGRVLDDAAKRLAVENINNRGGEETRLRIFHVESGEFLEFSDALGSAANGKVKSGGTIVLLRGAGVVLGK